MANIEYKTCSSHMTIEKADLDELRDAMRKVYNLHGGEHTLTESSPLVYENLDEFFKSRFQELDARVYEKPLKTEKDCLCPDPTFLRDLFYVKKNAQKMKSKQSNFDLCYFFAFGFSRQKYMANKRAKKGSNTASVQASVVVSSLSQYAKSIDSVENYMVTKVGRTVERDLRDVKSSSIGSLYSFHSDKNAADARTIYLVGKDHFFNENFVLDFVRLSKELKDSFVKNARIIFLDDVWQGDFNINNSAGVLRITQHWHSHIAFMEEQAQKRKGKKVPSKHLTLAKKANADIKESKTKTHLLIQEIPSLIKFLLNETQSMPYSYFMNTVGKEEVIKWLDTSSANKSEEKHREKTRKKQ